MNSKTILLCLVVALALGACAGKKPVLLEYGGNNCRHEKQEPEPV